MKDKKKLRGEKREGWGPKDLLSASLCIAAEHRIHRKLHPASCALHLLYGSRERQVARPDSVV